MRPRTPRQPQRLLLSRKPLLGFLLAMVLLLCSQAATAQIEPQKPGRVSAANRHALREAHRTDSPYKDSHLTVKPARLRRGQSAPPQAANPIPGNTEVDFEPAPAAKGKFAGLLGLRRKNKPQPKRAAPAEKN